VTQPSRWDVRVAVIYQDRVTFLPKRNTWKEVTVFMEGRIPADHGDTTFDEAAAVAKACEKAPVIEGLTMLGRGCVIGCSRRWWEEPELVAVIEAGRATVLGHPLGEEKGETECES
jgi:hypothetical protein